MQRDQFNFALPPIGSQQPLSSAGRAELHASKGLRAVGSKGATMDKTKVRRGGTTDNRLLLSKSTAASHEPGAPVMHPSQGDLEKGILSCQERGLLPGSFDMTPIMAGKYNNNAPLNVGGAKMHKAADAFKRQDVLTQNYGFAPVMNVKLDTTTIAQMPREYPPPKPPSVNNSVIPTRLAVPNSMKNITAKSLLDDDRALKEKERDDARQYAELLDMYSLHEFIIRKGQTLRSTPEFVSYQRKYVQQWGAITRTIQLLEELLTSYGVATAYIDGKKVAALASVDLGDPTKEELMNCISNRAEVEPLMVSVVQQFRQGDEGKKVAAIKVQALFRMWRQRTAYSHLKAATHAARRIQRQWGVHKAHVKTRKTLSLIREGLVFRWKDTMAQFIKDWPTIKQSRRLVIHLPSLSYPAFQTQKFPFYRYFQAGQLPRLMDLADPNVEMVFICPYQLEAEAMQYYFKVLRRAGVHEPESRVMMLVPELASKLPSHLSLTRMVLNSSRLMKVLASMVRGKLAYIVPGVVNQEELTFAAKLNLPLLGPEPKVSQILGTKSGLKSIFESAEVRPPIGAHNIKEERDLYLILARFIAEYPEYPRWLMKIDTEFSGRGTAVLEVRRLKCIERLQPDTSPQVVAEQVFTELKEHAGERNRIKMVNSSLYPDWRSFLSVFTSVGGCVEACPREVISTPVVNLFIEPSGEVNITSIQEQIVGPSNSTTGPYQAHGVVFPQTSVPHDAIRDAAKAIGHAAKKKKIMGYVTIDFVLHRKANDGGLKIWAVDMDLRLTTNALMHDFVMLMSDAHYDSNTGHCYQVHEDGTVGNVSQVSYAYSGLIYHPYIGALRHSVFFNLCRQKGLHFDTESRTGTLFHLVDVLLCGCIGLLGVGTTEAKSIKYLEDVLEFLSQHLQKQNAVVDSGDTNFNDVARAIRNVPQRVQPQGGGLEGSKRPQPRK